ncbi:hypothetical protein BpHYR1_047060 [Brachionus plicatilis]|uniref:Uncharacterized protein n=1 Tax=Brachionus plicatilis TaxID=10195 RepID=A0A3M7RXT4_BRAPC|nr:hypothetical protein BpHYR1_047060 [Brachionus plicatilis]
MQDKNSFYGQKFNYLFTEKKSRQKIYNQLRILRSNTNNSFKSNKLSESHYEPSINENISMEETSVFQIQSQLHLETLESVQHSSVDSHLKDLFLENEELCFCYSDSLLFLENVQNENLDVLQHAAFFLTMFFSAKFSQSALKLTCDAFSIWNKSNQIVKFVKKNTKKGLSTDFFVKI